MAVCVNNSLKVKMHGLVISPLKFICLGMDFSDHSDQEITDQLFDRKAQTFLRVTFKF